MIAKFPRIYDLALKKDVNGLANYLYFLFKDCQVSEQDFGKLLFEVKHLLYDIYGWKMPDVYLVFVKLDNFIKHVGKNIDLT